VLAFEGVQGRGSKLFRAVVVSGAALACSRQRAPSGPAASHSELAEVATPEPSSQAATPSALAVPSARAQAANRLHLRDEIDHARLGWAHLASPAVDEDLREALAECVPRLLAANVAIWLRRDDFVSAEGVPGHGVCAHADTVAVIERALQELVLPGFRHVGVRVDLSAPRAI
jgi:hypothetical protein